MKHLVILEPTDDGYSAYSPNLPGCIAAGDDRAETLDLMRDAIAFHIKGMEAEGMDIPAPSSEADLVEV